MFKKRNCFGVSITQHLPHSTHPMHTNHSTSSVLNFVQNWLVHNSQFEERCEKQWEDFTTAQYKLNQYLNETIVQLEEANNNLTKENIHLKLLMSEFSNKAGAK